MKRIPPIESDIVEVVEQAGITERDYWLVFCLDGGEWFIYDDSIYGTLVEAQKAARARDLDMSYPRVVVHIRLPAWSKKSK